MQPEEKDEARKAPDTSAHPAQDAQEPSGPNLLQRVFYGFAAALPFGVGALAAWGKYMEARKLSRDREAKPPEAAPKVLDVDAEVK